MKLPKTLLDFSVPAAATQSLKPSVKKVAKTLIDMPNPLCEARPASKPAKTLVDAFETTVPLPSRSEFGRIRRRRYYGAKTMLDRQAIAEMVEKFEASKQKRAAEAESRQKELLEFDKKSEVVEDKISTERAEIYSGDHPNPGCAHDATPLLIVALILASLSLLTFLTLPANPSNQPLLSHNVVLPWQLSI